MTDPQVKAVAELANKKGFGLTIVDQPLPGARGDIIVELYINNPDRRNTDAVSDGPQTIASGQPQTLDVMRALLETLEDAPRPFDPRPPLSE